MSVFIQLKVLAIYSLFNVASATGLSCFSCTHLSSPSDCDHVVQCGTHENCHTSMYVSSAGSIYYNTGCMPSFRCVPKRDLSKEMLIQDRSSDIEVCDACCTTSYCNRGGCGNTAPPIDLRVPICFNCAQEARPDSCEYVTSCPRDQVCSLETFVNGINGEIRYKSQCKTMSELFIGATNVAIYTRSSEHAYLFHFNIDCPFRNCSSVPLTLPSTPGVVNMATSPTTLQPTTTHVATHTHGYSGRMCFSCTRMPLPSDCDHVTQCGTSENCVVTQWISRDGYIYYDMGCRSHSQCPVTTGRRDLSDFTQQYDGISDIAICEECCTDSYCNRQGCSSKPPLATALGGPVCYNCPIEASPEHCSTVTTCPDGHICSLERFVNGINGEVRYKSQCKAMSECHIAGSFVTVVGRKRDTSCTGCCTSDYCNRDCSSVARNG